MPLFDGSQFELIVNTVPALISFVDTDLRYRYVNATYEKWFGVPREEAIGKTVKDLIGKDSFETLEPNLRRALKGESLQFESSVNTSEGIKHIDIHYTPSYGEDGLLNGIVILANDITGKKLLEEELTARANQSTELLRSNEALRKSEERYFKMVAEVKDYAILLLDRDGMLQNWNQGAEKIKGYTASEVIGKHFGIFYTFEDKERNLPETLLQQAAETGRAFSEGWRVRKDGSRFWASIVITALHNNEGAVIGFTKVTRDLTERKEAEDRLRSTTVALSEANKELEQFAYIASHDMKEPLRKIRILTSQALDLDNVPDKVLVGLQKIQDTTERMQNLIDDLLAYSSSGLELADMEPVDLNLVLSDIVENYTDILAEKGGSITVSPLPFIRGISFQLTQLFENLIGNAIKYQPPGGIPEVEVVCSVVPAENTGIQETTGVQFYCISVIDNGIGFDPGQADRIFEIFQRLHSRQAYSGTGIGLAICKKIVQRHGGSIQARSNGAGARFDVFFPKES